MIYAADETRPGKVLSFEMLWFKDASRIFKNDTRIEFRTRYALSTVLAFVMASLFLLLFMLRADQLEPSPKSALVWIIVLFAALSTLSRSFLAETDRNTYEFLRSYAHPTGVFIGKWLFNLSFTLVVNIFTFIFYLFFLDLSILSYTAFALIIFFGTAGLSSVTTLTAAIVSQADRKGAVFSVLSIPLLIPFFLILGKLTKIAFIDPDMSTGMNDLFALIGYVGVTFTAGFILFDFIWED